MARATGGAQRTIGVMSTPATGGMTLRVALSSGSVGMATMLHGRVLRSYLGNQERTTRMRKAIVKSVSGGPRKNLIGATHDTSPAAAGSTTDTRATTPASAAAVCGSDSSGNSGLARSGGCGADLPAASVGGAGRGEPSRSAADSASSSARQSRDFGML